MIVLKPRIHAFVEARKSRTLKQLEALGADPAQAAIGGSVVAITVAADATEEQRMLARALVDLTLRLDPLVRQVGVDGVPEADLASLGTRLPLEIHRDVGPADLHVRVGATAADCDLQLDAAGWSTGIGTPVAPAAPGAANPIGALAAAAIGTGEIFKALFALDYPDAPLTRRFVAVAGCFSWFDYRYDGANPPLEPFEIDTTLVGAGGVGAGVVAALAAFGTSVGGRLVIVDHDVLTRDNVNRVVYARVDSVLAGRPKAEEAKDFLVARAPNLEVQPYPDRFGGYKSSLAPRRAERRYDVVVTGLDDDDVRHEVQRELPRVLIDGATGRDANMIVERIMLGRWGCLGCTRRGEPTDPGAACDDPPDERAPSISFLSFLPGVLACGEVVKEALNAEPVEGAFRHVFLYGPSEDMLTTAAVSASCAIECGTPGVLRAYREKYAMEQKGDERG